MDFKIIQTWLYHERIIYLTQIGTKFQMFYRSSGRAGHNSQGNILPCYLLKEVSSYSSWMGDEFGSMPFMWIPKVYMKNDNFIPYRTKVENTFPEEMQKYFAKIKEFNKTTETNVIFEDQPKPINNFIRDYITDRNLWYDWGTDE